MKTTTPKSNTWVVVAPIFLWFAAGFIYIQYFQDQVHEDYDLLFVAGISLWFIPTAIAQLRSGYLWRNLAPGNRGEHRSISPKKFAFSTAFHIVAGVAIAIFFSYQFVNRGEQDGTGQPATSPVLKSEGNNKPQPESEGRSR